MDFIGRTSELATLNAELERGSGFVVIYGRRRVGKTTLIKEFIKDKRAFYFLATTESEAQSMKRFAGVLSRTTKNPMLSKVTFTDWLDLFQVVADDHPDEKKVLVIDEFPYLVKTNPDFPSILQNAWDEVLKDHNVMLVLCGSLISMMKKHALAYDSPLYGRRTAQIRLMPLQFTDVYAAQNLSFEQAVEQYAITGGVPKYMEFFQTDEPLVEQIRRVVLSKNGFLYEEPDFLLNEEVQTPINYFSVLKAISDGNHKLSKIGMTMAQDTSAITPYLKTLIDLGFVIKNVPITEKNPERSRKSLYYVSDNFIRFWFRYVYPFKGELELDNQQIVLDEMGKYLWLSLMRASAGTSLRSCAERGRSTLHPHALALTGEMIMRAIRKLMLRLWTTSTNGCSLVSASTMRNLWMWRSTLPCKKRGSPKNLQRPLRATKLCTDYSLRAALPIDWWRWLQRIRT